MGGCLPNVFERFYSADPARARASGGIGLAVVKQPVEAHGGRLAVESALGRGSTFGVSLAAVTAAARRREAS